MQVIGVARRLDVLRRILADGLHQLSHHFPAPVPPGDVGPIGVHLLKLVEAVIDRVEAAALTGLDQAPPATAVQGQADLPIGAVHRSCARAPDRERAGWTPLAAGPPNGHGC